MASCSFFVDALSIFRPREFLFYLIALSVIFSVPPVFPVLAPVVRVSAQVSSSHQRLSAMLSESSLSALGKEPNAIEGGRVEHLQGMLGSFPPDLSAPQRRPFHSPIQILEVWLPVVFMIHSLNPPAFFFVCFLLLLFWPHHIAGRASLTRN